MSFNWTPEELQEIVENNQIVLFMKGTPVMPQCGFSAAVVGVLSHMGIKYNSSKRSRRS